MQRFSSVSLSVVLVCLLMSSCNSDPSTGDDGSPSTYEPSDSARAHFLLDATDFAVEYLIATRSPDQARISVPENVLNSYLLPLARLYDERARIPLLDTLIIQQRIHKQQNNSYSLLIHAETRPTWVYCVKNKIFPTRDPIVDSLVVRYNLQFEDPILWDFMGTTWFATIQPPLNTFALGRAFREAPGVLETTPNFLSSYGTKLEVLPSGSKTLVRFYRGYGDCSAGCPGYDRWTFSVSKEYDVTYEGYLHE